MLVGTMAKRITKQWLEADKIPKQPEQVVDMIISWQQEADMMDKQTSKWQEADLTLVEATKMSCHIASQSQMTLAMS